MFGLQQEKIEPLGGGHEFQPGASRAGKGPGAHQLAVLADIELVGRSGFVLIVDHAGSLTVIVCKLRWKDIFIAFGAAFGGGDDKSVVRIHKNQFTAVQLRQGILVPGGADSLPFRLCGAAEVQRFRIVHGRKDGGIFQCHHLPPCGADDPGQRVKQQRVTYLEGVFCQIFDVPSIPVVAFIRNQIPVHADG